MNNATEYSYNSRNFNIPSWTKAFEMLAVRSMLVIILIHRFCNLNIGRIVLIGAPPHMLMPYMRYGYTYD